MDKKESPRPEKHGRDDRESRYGLLACFYFKIVIAKQAYLRERRPALKGAGMTVAVAG
jgi:hypothetical protein